jgi:ADP-ribose pyrophosphatase YjhB (NUDIX family)
MQVKARAIIWHGDRVIVARESRQGTEHLTIPGGRPRPRESVMDALAREVREETGLEIHVGRLLYVAECVNSYSLQDLILVFSASPATAIDLERVALVDPRHAGAASVLPPLLGEVARDAPGPPYVRWLGNLWRPETVPAA